MLDWLFPWRPMESFPRNGLPVMLRCGARMIKAQWTDNGWLFQSPAGMVRGLLVQPDAWTPCLVNS